MVFPRRHGKQESEVPLGVLGMARIEVTCAEPVHQVLDLIAMV